MGLDVLFLGRLFPHEKESEIKAKMKTGMQDAANALQWNIIDGLEANDCGRMRILNYLPVDSYPKGYTEKNIEEFSFVHTDKYDCEDLNVGCTNLSVIKQFANVYPFKREIKKWALDKNKEKKVLVLYTATRMFLSLAEYAKKLNPVIKTCCIIADIPEYATASDLHGVRKLYSLYQTNKCASLYKYIDKFVLLTKQMAERLNIKVPFTVMEGIAPENDSGLKSETAEIYKNQKYILYTGTLNYKFGIGVLLDAFAMIKDENANLIICGFGQAEERIKEDMKCDSRIVYLGKLDRTDALALQRNATVLVNPRQNNEEFTKYSFPSKTMEYLASGVPLVAYKLDGMPDEYDSYINYVPDNSPESLAREISKVLNMSDEERVCAGEAAQAFVAENKNYIVQSKKILDFISYT
ncbi:MAG: glycosyltransferase [Clostridia bacterium]|nr:glycosyltransferase [Clostridia bacterium]